MKTKISCTVAVFSLLCVGYASAGTLFKSKKTEGNEVAAGKESAGSATPGAEAAAGATKEAKPDHVADDDSDDEAEPEASKSVPKSSSGAAAGQEKKKSSDPVVIKIGRKEIKLSQVLAGVDALPPQIKKAIPAGRLFEILRTHAVAMHVLCEQAKKVGLDKTKEYVEQLGKLSGDLLANLLVKREVTPKIMAASENEAVLKSEYARYLAGFKKGKEYKLSFMTLKSESDVSKVLERLKTEDFAAVAKDNGAPVLKDGGEYVPINMLPKSVSSKLAVLKPGEYTKEAIKVGGNFLIFKVSDIRDAEPLKFEEAKQSLLESLTRREERKLLLRLKKQYKVEEFNEDGTPFNPDAPVSSSDEGDSGAEDSPPTAAGGSPVPTTGSAVPAIHTAPPVTPSTTPTTPLASAAEVNVPPVQEASVATPPVVVPPTVTAPAPVPTHSPQPISGV
ncbi:MAG: peptidyl-prolyl cis-trans isomerase [Holosporaceae bacterium]|jgi:peptidyl-prolyl cis-trans isomerase C|nr:peptidyl-prolyl cis-trans isomerase [Holosporaceae bacterium]